ncbi:MAG: D-tyrosyl-tRNA(Tyr) deacylase [Muribaculaceae bacterium]|nr:D-tyrosyl-tRNA(Tyr) deacylase [Muribaculaceae bacterium]MDE6359814.1 D-tyrosyl-tRNA(Tyr) deacylase [Muribaculaceae bacterium]
MRAVVQRVSRASVEVGGEQVSGIGRGLLVLVCVETGDRESDMEWLTKKIAGLRIFEDESGVMNLDVTAVGGEILAVSQFTLVAGTRKGNRPSYIRAAAPQEAVPMYEEFCRRLESLTGRPVGRGRFGADMKVSLINDGPVTIIIDSRLKE